MNRFFILCLGVLLIGMSFNIQAKSKGIDVVRGKVAEGKGKKFRLFILSGQSNMQGLDHEKYVLPVLEKAFTGDEILIIKWSKGGQPIKNWMKDGKPQKFYTTLIKMVNDEIGKRKPDSVSFMWMQGEADAKREDPKLYVPALKNLIAQIRKDTGHPNATAIIGRLNQHSDKEGWIAIRKAQVEVADADPKVDWIDLDDLGKGLHYKAQGYEKMGQRFAESTIKLLNE